jgi:hypothetical protein
LKRSSSKDSLDGIRYLLDNNLLGLIIFARFSPQAIKLNIILNQAKVKIYP